MKVAARKKNLISLADHEFLFQNGGTGLSFEPCDAFHDTDAFYLTPKIQGFI